MSKTTLIVLPTTLFHPKLVIPIAVKHNVKRVLFVELWDAAMTTPVSSLIFHRATMQNTYHEYFTHFHDEDTQFDYIDCDELGSLAKHVNAAQSIVLQPLCSADRKPIDANAVLGKVPRVRVEPQIEFKQVAVLPIPSRRSDRSIYHWLAADTYVKQKYPNLKAQPTPQVEANIRTDIQSAFKAWLGKATGDVLPEYFARCLACGLLSRFKLDLSNFIKQ